MEKSNVKKKTQKRASQGMKNQKKNWVSKKHNHSTALYVCSTEIIGWSWQQRESKMVTKIEIYCYECWVQLWIVYIHLGVSVWECFLMCFASAAYLLAFRVHVYGSHVMELHRPLESFYKLVSAPPDLIALLHHCAFWRLVLNHFGILALSMP